MVITINLTAVLMTAFICFTICYACKTSKDENTAGKKPLPQMGNVIEIPKFVAERKSSQEQHLVEYVENYASQKGDI